MIGNSSVIKCTHIISYLYIICCQMENGTCHFAKKTWHIKFYVWWLPLFSHTQKTIVLLLPLSSPSQLNSLRPNLSAAGSNQTRSLSGGFNLPSWQTVGQSDDVTTVTISKYDLPKSNLNHSKYMRYNWNHIFNVHFEFVRTVDRCSFQSFLTQSKKNTHSVTSSLYHMWVREKNWIHCT